MRLSRLDLHTHADHLPPCTLVWYNCANASLVFVALFSSVHTVLCWSSVLYALVVAPLLEPIHHNSVEAVGCLGACCQRDVGACTCHTVCVFVCSVTIGCCRQGHQGCWDQGSGRVQGHWSAAHGASCRRTNGTVRGYDCESVAGMLLLLLRLSPPRMIVPYTPYKQPGFFDLPSPACCLWASCIACS